MNEDRIHQKHVQLTSLCPNVVEPSDVVLNTKLFQQTLAQRMVIVMLEDDITAEKKANNAVGASSNKAPASVDATKLATTCTCRRLKLETRQVLDDAIYSSASRVMNREMNVRKKRKTIP